MALDARKIWTSPQLPTLSEVSKKVLEHSRHPATAPRELDLIFRSDAAFSEKLVRIANSPWANLSSPVESTDQALLALGVTNVISLALNRFIVDVYQTPIPIVPNLSRSEQDRLTEHASRFWSRGITKAIAAEMLCQHVRDGLESEYFLAGLMLDLGQFVLLRTVPREFLSVHSRSRHANLPCWEFERVDFGQTAAELGSQLLEQWGFPTRLVRAVKLQHANVSSFKNMESQSDCSLSRALALADAIGDALCNDQQALSLFRIRELTRELLPMPPAELDALLQAIVQRFEAIAPVFASGTQSILGPCLSNINELQTMAIEQLTRLGGRLTDIEIRKNPGEKALPTDIERRGLAKDSTADAAHSHLDPLTQVYQRDYFESTLNREVQRCCQIATPIGIAVVEIDRLSTMSEQFGQEYGNLALARVAQITRELMRSSDTIGRIDHQLAILASNPTATGIQKLSDRIRSRVDGEKVMCSGQSVPITVSIGSCLALPGRTDSNIGWKVLATAQRATSEAAFGEGNNIYFSSLVDEVELHRLFMANQMRFSRWLVSQGVLDIPRVAKALINFQQRPLRMGDLAIRQELLSQTEVQKVLAEQEQSNCRFGDIAVRRTFLTEEQLNGLLILQQEDPILVAALFIKQSLLEPQRLKGLLRDYFAVVPWTAPLHPAAGRG